MSGLKANELKELLERGECELVDVREPVEWMGGRIAGARHIPLGEFAGRMGEVGQGRPVVVMCRSGKRSCTGAELLRARGMEGVRELEGGYLAWEAAGLPTERDERAPWPLDRQVRFAAGLLVVAGLGLSLLWPPAIAVSWFVGGGLVFAALTDWCGMGLLLSKAPWNRVRGGRACGTGGRSLEA